MKKIFRIAIPAAALVLSAILPFAATGQTKKPAAPKSLRLYILDCGDITGVGETQFGFKQGQLADSRMVTPCYLVVHPRGTMIWDTGEIPDADFKGNPTKAGAFAITRPLLPQLAALGYTPADITYLALSHYHGDHVANANAFAGSNWIVQDVERAAMFAKQDAKAKGPTTPDLAYFSKLEKSKTTLLHSEDHDVFGDGTVIIKFTPGHTPGHQSLFLKFAKTGPVVLSGDLYHYPEERSLGIVPGFDFNADQTRKSRADLEAFIKKSGAVLWIQHGTADNAKLKKAPEFYE
ncbi:MAG TPA: N-acyl homoserine lactonase family protein [Bryobacteraceae bacterium]|nr:N-acyl homoserine lactonase family protein [Bryobacteraceae bacterium]